MPRSQDTIAVDNLSRSKETCNGKDVLRGRLEEALALFGQSERLCRELNNKELLISSCCGNDFM